ncbi:MAG: hypothetical protein F6J86_11315 [Symploca sp. SIO1B1]|nr:hypothetical protein [Symploca sp. SIO1B1]
MSTIFFKGRRNSPQYCSVKRSYRFRELRELRELGEKNWSLTEQYWNPPHWYQLKVKSA